MYKIANIICLDCNAKDVANWSDFGAEQSCLNCDAPAVNLVKVVN
jgi:hypothetical protein